MTPSLDDFELKEAIRRCYLTVLEREPDTIGLEYYFNKIRNRKMQLENLPMIFTNSLEYVELQKNKEIELRIRQQNVTTDITLKNTDVVLKQIDNHKIYLNANDAPLLESFSQKSIYEKTTVNLLKKLLKKGMNVINIGANIGYFTLLIARGVDDTGKVFAFEPFPPTVKLLQKNVNANGYKNVEIIPKAVSDRNCQLELCVGTSSVHNFISSKDVGLQKLSVESVTIDSFLEGKKIKIDLLMMDAEGSEKYILEGMTKTIRDNPNLEIITEYNPYTFELAGTTGEAFLDTVEKLGFSILLIDEDENKVKPVAKGELLKAFAYPRYTNIYLSKNPDKMAR